jgi:hypothetical protein
LIHNRNYDDRQTILPTLTDKSDPVIFLTVVVNTSSLVYDDIVRLFFLVVDGESSILSGELREKSDQFHPLRDTRLVDLKLVGLILDKVSGMRVTIPIYLSKRTFNPLPHFFNSRRPTPLLNPPSVIFPLNPSLVIFPSYFHNNLPKRHMMCSHC